MKRLLLLVILVGAGYGFYTYILPRYGIKGVLKAVNGIQTSVGSQNYSKLLPVESVSSPSAAHPAGLVSLQSLKDQVSLLQVREIASSSPQIQQILKQLQSLPNDKLKEMCIQMCGRL